MQSKTIKTTIIKAIHTVNLSKTWSRTITKTTYSANILTIQIIDLLNIVYELDYIKVHLHLYRISHYQHICFALGWWQRYPTHGGVNYNIITLKCQHNFWSCIVSACLALNEPPIAPQFVWYIMNTALCYHSTSSDYSYWRYYQNSDITW